MLLVVDNGSIFTKNLFDFLSFQNINFKLLTFDKINLVLIEKFDSFILSGRRSNDKQMNLLNSKIIRHCVHKSKKLLGICYGAEMLALSLGGTIRKMTHLQKGDQIIKIIANNSLANSSITVHQSHRYELSNLGKELLHIGTSDKCQYEIIQHKNNKIFGTQFHPEMTDDGHRLIMNFLNL